MNKKYLPIININMTAGLINMEETTLYRIIYNIKSQIIANHEKEQKIFSTYSYNNHKHWFNTGWIINEHNGPTIKMQKKSNMYYHEQYDSP